MDVYPIMLKLTGRRVAVVGAGPIALRKAHWLRSAGATVRLISRHLPADADLTDLDVIHDDYHSRHVEGATLVFACTDDADVNRQIAEDARRAGALANCVDQRDDCDFFSAAVVTDGPVVVAVGTSGAAPGLARQLAASIEEELPPQIGAFATVLGALRQVVQDAVDDVTRRGEIMARLTGPDGYQMFVSEGEPGLRRMLAALLG